MKAYYQEAKEEMLFVDMKDWTIWLNPNRLLEPKHILFYYREDCLASVRRCIRSCNVIKINKAVMGKQKMVGNNTIVGIMSIMD